MLVIVTTRRAPAPIALALGIMLASACTVGGISLEGRRCPCVGSYVCDQASGLCLFDPRDATVGPPDGLVPPTDAPGETIAPPLLFRDDFDGGISDDWRVMTDDAGVGGWSVGDGGLPTQSTIDTAFSFLYLPGLASATDYRVIGRMRPVAGTGAMEIVYRINLSPSEVAYYFCAYEPTTGLLVIQAGLSGSDGATIDYSELGRQQAVNFLGHENDWVTMTVEAVGTSFRCKLDEILVQELQVVAVVPTFVFAQGAVGFKTYYLAAQFQSIEVYDLTR
jgi:hypothetical protein